MGNLATSLQEYKRGVCYEIQKSVWRTFDTLKAYIKLRVCHCIGKATLLNLLPLLVLDRLQNQYQVVSVQEIYDDIHVCRMYSIENGIKKYCA